MPLFFHSSNQLHILAQLFFRDLAEARQQPLARQRVVVQTTGMGRWLSLQLAEQSGICAGLDFLFPNRIINELFSSVLPQLPQLPDQDEMIWRVMDLLPRLCAADAAFTPVKHYLDDDPQGRKLFQLAAHLADLFDQYQIYRPDMILAWQENRPWFSTPPYNGQAADHRWQQRLWQAMDLPVNRATTWHNFLAALAEPNLDLPGQQPIFIFGVSVMPPFHLHAFEAAARIMDIHFYQLTPCREYWGFIKNRREIRKAERATGSSADELFMTDVNPLLASQGVLGRDFLNMVLDLSTPYQQEELFTEEKGTSHLHLIQHDLLNLLEPSQGREQWQPNDHSLAFHSCHSPLREVEVMHDQLLHYMADHDLSSSDILVMCPDLASYAPLIRAVFSEKDILPYTVADLPTSTMRIMMDSLFLLLHLLASRFSASEVIGLLEQGPVADAFDLSPADVALVREWLPQAAICWGLDNNMMDKAHGPRQVGWQAGLDRLLLGFAMAVDDDREVAGIFPFADFPEDEAPLLGRFLDFLARLKQFQQQISASRPLAEWQDLLQQLLDCFFRADGEQQQGWLAIHAMISPDSDQPRQGPPISFSVLQSWLRRRYENTLNASGFMGGGITCCAMLPMRSIPFRLIYLLGMNDGAFPRLDRRLDYDLLQYEKRPGDRSSKDNDRYLFLETIISAQEFLAISYCGRSQTDNAPLPPSTLVAELYDYLKIRFRLTSAEEKELTTEHRLQGYHASYFQDHSRRISFDRQNYLAAKAHLSQPGPPPPFFDTPLPAPELGELGLDELINFFTNPIRALYKKRLGLNLQGDSQILVDHEPFDIDGLTQYQLRQQIMNEADPDPDQRLATAHAKGKLPDGNPGAWLTGRLSDQLHDFLAWLRPWQHEAQPAREVELSLGKTILRGRLTSLFSHHQLLHCPVNLEVKTGKESITVARPRELIRAWLAHLFLCASGPAPQTTILAGLDCTAVGFRPVAHPEDELRHLLSFYQQGMKEPLLFFPDYSLAWRQGESMARLHGKWENDAYHGAGNIYHRHALADAVPMDQEEFFSLAKAIGDAIYDHLEALH